MRAAFVSSGQLYLEPWTSAGTYCGYSPSRYLFWSGFEEKPSTQVLKASRIRFWSYMLYASTQVCHDPRSVVSIIVSQTSKKPWTAEAAGVMSMYEISIKFHSLHCKKAQRMEKRMTSKVEATRSFLKKKKCFAGPKWEWYREAATTSRPYETALMRKMELLWDIMISRKISCTLSSALPRPWFPGSRISICLGHCALGWHRIPSSMQREIKTDEPPSRRTGVFFQPFQKLLLPQPL